MEMDEVIRSRRSIRHYSSMEIPLEVVEELLELASWAPSASNRQMWFFYAVHDPTTKEQIAQAIEDQVTQIATWPQVTQLENLDWLRRYSGFVREAPWVIVFCQEVSTNPFEQILKERGLTADQIARWRPQGGLQSVSAAIQNFLLAAAARKLGAVWMVGPLFAVEGMEKILELPTDRRIVAIVPLGIPAENPDPRPRKPKEKTWKVI
jgi:nitroreductase